MQFLFKLFIKNNKRHILVPRCIYSYRPENRFLGAFNRITFERAKVFDFFAQKVEKFGVFKFLMESFQKVDKMAG